MRYTSLLFLFFIGSCCAYAQSTYLPLNQENYQKIARYEIRQGHFYDFHTGVKPYLREDVVASVAAVDVNTLSARDSFNLQYFQEDSWEFGLDSTAYNNAKKPIFKVLYKNKADFLKVNEPDFDFHINPVLNISGGLEGGNKLFTNTRGVEMRGMIDGKVGFYSYLADNQVFFPDYMDERVTKYKAVPGGSFYKPFKDTGYDYFDARGYVAFNFTKHITTQFGYDKNAFGDGHRSLIMSDYAAPNTFWKINLKVWKLNYQVIYNFMNTGQYSNPLYQPNTYEDKFNVFHHLSLNIGKNLNIGVFETVTYAGDSGQNTSFEMSYLNPVIFYRSIEGNVGSSNGNAILGTNFKWNFFRHFQLYGQLVLDEFKLDELKGTNGDGWWANKYGVQLGGKYIDAFGLKNLDLQGEYNVVRPYTYSHSRSRTSYSHYGQSLAHPLGANFQEVVGIVRYQPFDRLSLTGKLMYANVGLDTLDSNWGQNVLYDYTTREQDYNNTIGQGVSTDIIYAALTTSYMFKHNWFIDAQLVYRKEASDIEALSNDTFFATLGFRCNIALRDNGY